VCTVDSKDRRGLSEGNLERTGSNLRAIMQPDEAAGWPSVERWPQRGAPPDSVALPLAG
jgi:hypothetical protein